MNDLTVIQTAQVSIRVPLCTDNKGDLANCVYIVSTIVVYMHMYMYVTGIKYTSSVYYVENLWQPLSV